MNKVEFGYNITKFINAFTAAMQTLGATVSYSNNILTVSKGDTTIMTAFTVVLGDIPGITLRCEANLANRPGPTIKTSIGNYERWVCTYHGSGMNNFDNCFTISYVMTIGKTVALGHSTYSPIPSMYIGETDLGNIGIIGMRNDSTNQVQFLQTQMLTYNMVKAPQSYDLRSWGALSEMSAMVNMTIPGSTEGEYFKDIYLMLSRETLTAGQIKLNGKIFYSAGYIAVLDDDSGSITPVVPAKSPGVTPFNFYNKAGQFGDVATGFAEGCYSGVAFYNSSASVGNGKITFPKTSNDTWALRTPFFNSGYSVMLITCKATGGYQGIYNTSSVRLYSDWNENDMSAYNTGGKGTCWGQQSFTNYGAYIYDFQGTKAINVSASIGQNIYITFHDCDTPFEIYGITFI